MLIHISGPPLIRSTPVVKAIEGKRLQVSCPASGYPIEQITWQKGKNHMHWPVNFTMFTETN